MKSSLGMILIGMMRGLSPFWVKLVGVQVLQQMKYGALTIGAAKWNSRVRTSNTPASKAS